MRVRPSKSVRFEHHVQAGGITHHRAIFGRSVHGSGSLRDILEHFIERNTLRRSLWFEAVQPVKEFHQHFQRVLFVRLHYFAKTFLLFLHTWIILDLEVLPVERDGVAKEELRGGFEYFRDFVQGEVEV